MGIIMSSRTRQLREENREAARFLSQTSNAALDDITDRLRAVSINAYQIETVRQDVIRMLTDAEARGDTPEDVLGDDYDAFCSNVLAALPQPPLSYQFLNTLRTMLRVAVRCSVVSLLLHMPENIAGVRQNWGPFDLPESVRRVSEPEYFTITLGFLLGWLLLLAAFFIIDLWRTRTAGRKRTGSESMLSALLYALVLALLIAVGLLFPQKLFRMHISAILVLLAAMYGLWKLLDAKLD